MTSLFDIDTGGTMTAPRRRVILMDLNVALSENFSEMRRHNFATFVRSVERYRQWMVDLLREEEVILITARDSRWSRDTLKRIHDTTGWLPQHAYFNDTGVTGANAPEVKRRLLRNYVYPEFGPASTRYLAIESNGATREMYRREGIKAIDCERNGKWHAIPA